MPQIFLFFFVPQCYLLILNIFKLKKKNLKQSCPAFFFSFWFRITRNLKQIKIIITVLLIDILIIFFFPQQSFFGMTQFPPLLHFIFSSVSNNPWHPASLPIRRLSPSGTLHPNMPSNLIYGWVSHSPLPFAKQEGRVPKPPKLMN